MLKILIVDDHVIVREGLKLIIKENPDMEVSGETGHGGEVLTKVLHQQFDLVLLDISMPGMSGLEVLKQLKKEKPDLPVLILSMYPEEQYAVRALRAGASGYLTKEGASDELIAAIRKVTRGGKYVSLSLAEKLASYLDEGTGIHPHEKLSDREFQVMMSIVTGKALKEIAAGMSLSIKTISTYKARILEKMQMKSDAELTRYAVKNDLVD
ncbi:MAG: response regulator transcription factor [Gemmatimonadota bacterium]|nr:response regulator transcription factor [Gemmatimonadota bacterium]